MTRTLSVDALGTVVRIDGSALSDEAWAATQAAWRDGVVERAAVDTAATVPAHGSLPTRSMLSALSTEVTLAALEARAGELLMLHAAGLATADGRVVALVGPSGRGKTTASRILGTRFGYVSDESVGIAADGTVHPYRKPLSLMEDDQVLKVQRSPTELNLLPLPTMPLRLAALVLLERDDSATTPRSERVDLAEGITALAEQSSFLGTLPAPLHVIASHVESVGGVQRVVYSDAESLVAVVQELGAREPTPPGPVAGPVEPAAVAVVSRPLAASSYRRVEALDWLALEDGRLALLVRDHEASTRVVVLDGIAPSLWHATAQPTPVTALVGMAISVHGHPDGVDAASLVRASLAELVDAGLMIRA
ncbi:hypothetical protein [Microbacterium atlanticum]|uniref:hypothetical protein n=1 Tax=Microbacterium atlanticum TaxID=2782168 RepID=UPI001886B4E1|nr:hypothetical protein [Microbacterium atlanticum]